MSFLDIDNLEIDLGEFVVRVDELHLSRGDYLVIIGPTGSGKSIFLETIMGFFEPISGTISLDGADLTTLPPEERDVSIVYQDHCLFPHMTVEENIAYGLRKQTEMKENIHRQVHEIAAMMGIDHVLNRYPGTLSGGELQRASIARAIIVNPRLLLMDEPFSALDQRTKISLRKLIADIRDNFETTVIHVTHDLDDIWWLSNKVAVMNHGKIIQMGKKEEVINKPSPYFVADFLGANILEGTVEGQVNGLTSVNVNSNIFRTVDCGEGSVILSIRPENIMIAADPFMASAQNIFKGTVEDIIETSRIVYVNLRIGDIVLTSAVTPGAVTELGIRTGEEFQVLIKATNVRIIGEKNKNG
ncbi:MULTISPECIES: ATP-binding cassette domain-containing protein [Methanothermobacter]|uniref:ATP-binding cassette domain-containing protein n=1 Tax=Methanothermobacter TaxID=145260 RepID=UPI000B602CBF|nr:MULTISPECIES: ATP-binding cassette domain-containing protein [Methanothermobacter]WBF07133.1 ATP-binding cassette domain-containing protein [Methanothermobacter thermautotrophicus]BAZ98952.1 Putative 2-aminoethylphosphonate import ATP-binding protein PhnT [Methanothermobacter sp. EMTCatA1]